MSTDINALRVTEEKTVYLFDLAQQVDGGDSLALIAMSSVVNSMDLATARQYVVAGFILAASLSTEQAGAQS